MVIDPKTPVLPMPTPDLPMDTGTPVLQAPTPVSSMVATQWTPRPLQFAEGHEHEDIGASNARIRLADRHGYEVACASAPSIEVATLIDDFAQVFEAYITSDHRRI